MTEVFGPLIDGTTFACEQSSIVTNPATGEPIAGVGRADRRLVASATEVARTRFEEGVWRRAPVSQRRQVLTRLAELVRRDSEELAQTETANTGKPIGAARGEMAAVADAFDYYAGAIDKFGGATIPSEADGTLLTFREPIGVCAAITPWNFPLPILAWKVAPALALGNSVVAKPAQITPLTALALGRLALEADLPSGVFNIVTGAGSEVGEALVTDDKVAKISFTGSTEVGSRIMKLASDSIKRVSLELGGKSANLVFADADLDQCVESSVWAVYDNAGQDCCARSRTFVQRPILDEFLERFVERSKGIKLGDPTDESTEMGPLVSFDHRRRVESYMALGESEGASRLCGGERPGEEGAFLTPAVFSDVHADMRIMQEEIFGPVACITAFDTEEQAVALANQSDYGLSGSVWTRDIGRALRVVRAVDTGVISVNSSSSVHIEAPFGGVKQSGLGREQGMAALEQYSEYKTVFIGSDLSG